MIGCARARANAAGTADAVGGREAASAYQVGQALTARLKGLVCAPRTALRLF